MLSLGLIGVRSQIISHLHFTTHFNLASPIGVGSREEALQGDAKRKYFEHAGALLTADGTDDDLIKLEGTPPGYKVIIPK